MNGITHVLVEDWKSAVYTGPKTLALFLTTALAFRFLQRRAIAQFTPIDWLTAVVCGSVIGAPRPQPIPHGSTPPLRC